VNEAIFILNGVNITADTEGIETLRERIYYDEDLRGYLREIGGELTLNGDAFRFVKDRFKFDFDNPIPCSLSVFNPHTEIIESVFNGVIFPADCEFDLYAKKVTCQLVDTTFFAKIDNNKNLKFTINAGLSKLGVDISGRGGEIDYQMVSRMWAVNGIQTGDPSFPELGRFTKAQTLYQALDYLVAAMTDGDVAFFSTFLTDSATDPNYVILSGEQVRMADPLIARRPYVSWAELFGDLSRQFNLLMAVEEFEPNRFRIRVEPYAFWKQQQLTDLFEVKPRVKERVDIAMLPSSVLVGSAKVEKKLPIPSADMVNKFPGIAPVVWVPPAGATGAAIGYYNFVPETPFIYHWQEEYNFEYQSNVDTPKTLRHSILITDTSIYQYQVTQYWARFVISGFDTEQDVDTTYDEEVFLIHSTAELTAYGATVRRPVIYQEPTFSIINRDINNLNTMILNLGNLPASASLLYSFLNSNLFRAYYTPSGTQPTIFRDSPNGQKTLHLIQEGEFPNAATGDFIGNTTFFGVSGAGILSGDLNAPNNLTSIAYLNTVAGFNDINPPGFDNSGTYNTTAFSWTAPFAGSYSFSVYFEVFTTKFLGATLAQWDSGGVLKRAIRFGNLQLPNNFSPFNYIAQLSAGWTTFSESTGMIGAQAGDVFQLVFDTVLATSFFEPAIAASYMSSESWWGVTGVSIPSAGGTVITVNNPSSYIIENELEADIPLNIWNQIKSNPFAKFLYQVADDGEARVGYLKDFDREIISGRFNGITKPERPLPPETPTQTDPIEEEIPEPDEPE
jgi:hypothetical protein